MKTELYIIFALLYYVNIYSQVADVNKAQIKDIQYYQLNNVEKQNIIKELGFKYNTSSVDDTVYREDILNFFIDTIIVKDKINSPLAAKSLLQYARLNEINSLQKSKLLSICEQGYFNVDLVQFIGLLGDTSFIVCLNETLNKTKKLREFEKDNLINALARLGDREALDSRLNYLKSAYMQNDKKLGQEFAKQLNYATYINRQEMYNLIFDFVRNDNNKQVIIGDYGGGDEIYCTLSSFSMEILSKVIIGFPFERVICNDDSNDDKQNVISSWKKDNVEYRYYLWHPYYGINYSYWPER